MTEELVSFPTAKLAKRKGFDEECMHYFEWYEDDGGVHGPTALQKPIIDFREWEIPLEETRKRWGLYNQVFHPQKNSKLQPWLYARPTQDPLEDWIRARGIHAYAKIILGCREKNIPPLFVAGVYPSMFKDEGEKWEGKRAWALRRDARDEALLYALNLLPDAQI